MDFIPAVKSCLVKYFDFNGRAPRSEVWFFLLFQFGLGLAAVAVDIALLERPPTGFQPANTLVAVAFFLPNWAVSARRLHDLGLSGWWAAPFFLALAVNKIAKEAHDWIAGWIDLAALSMAPAIAAALAALMLMVFSLRGTTGPNRYGADPLSAAPRMAM